MILQDKVVFCVQQKVPLTLILSLDFQGFTSLHESCLRNQARDRIEEAWATMYAAQGKGTDLQKFLKPYEKLLRMGASGLDEFLAAFPKGID